jgi:PAS domain S-box-containing protein
MAMWSLGYSFSTGAKDVTEALAWRGVSTMGWTYLYSTMLIFFIAITNAKWAKKYIQYSFLLYIPSTVFFLRFLNYDTGNYVQSVHGWIYVLYFKSIWSTAFDLYYLICVVISFMLLLIWRKTSDSLRERKQVQIIISTMLVAFLCGALTDTILPLFGLKILPLAILFMSLIVSGIWIAITKYKMMNLTQEIAAENVLITMMDPVFVTNMDFVIGRVNKAATDLTGFASNDLVGEDIAHAIRDFGPENATVKELLLKGFINGHELELTSKSGKQTPCLCSGVCVKTDYGERIGIVLVLHDITSRKISERLIELTNEQLNLKIDKINNVFDNVGEGILTFNKDLKVQNEYSLECEKIFNQKIENKSFAELIFPNNHSNEQFLSALLIRIFESNPSMRALYFPLLPDEVIIQDKVVNIHYKLTTDEADDPIIMVILSDITEKNQLESKMDQERKTLKMVVKTLLNREDFIELLDEFNTFVHKDYALLKSDHECLLRKIHTLKGNFSQFYMLHLIDHLDKIEDALHNKNSTVLGDIDLEALKSWLTKDMEILENYVGKGYFKEGERFTIDNSQLLEIETKIHLLLDAQDAALILPLIKNLRHKTFHELLVHYPDYTVKLGERWHKNIQAFEITGDLIYVDAKAYHDVTKSLIHIFRNCVSHGIETEDERLESGKGLNGKIRCDIKAMPSSIQICISDDGRGINVQALERKALSEGLISQEELNAMSQDDKLQLIFKQRLSTQESATTLSGRGVGLSAVDEAVKQHGGSIQVTSVLNKGTTFMINLPK